MLDEELRQKKLQKIKAFTLMDARSRGFLNRV